GAALATIATTIALAAATALISAVAPAQARPSDPGVVNYAVLPKGSVSNIVGAQLRWEAVFTEPVQAFYVDNPVCNNWADIGLPEVYLDPDLASFNRDRKSTRLNSSHVKISYAVICLKKKKP